MRESEFQTRVIDLARLSGWMVHHTRPAQLGDRWITPVAADGVGFPDLVLVATRRDIPPPRLMFIELKTDTGRLTATQARWGDTLTAASTPGGSWMWDVWRPRDWERIVTRLTVRHPAGGRP